MKITIGSDHAGFALKKVLIDHLQRSGHHLTDVGTDSTEPVDYPDYAEAVARGVLHGGTERGILICGTGIGMSISANKLPKVRAANNCSNGPKCLLMCWYRKLMKAIPAIYRQLILLFILPATKRWP